jgi:hypothetical protein
MLLIFKFLLSIGCIGAAAGGIFFGKKHLSAKAERIIENTVEDVIKEETGIVVDFDTTNNEGEESVIAKEATYYIVDEINKLKSK